MMERMWGWGWHVVGMDFLASDYRSGDLGREDYRQPELESD